MPDIEEADVEYDHQDTERCTTCGGDCCRLYVNGMHGSHFLGRIAGFMANQERGPYVPFSELDPEKIPAPRFDALRAWGKYDTAYRTALLAKGINPEYCEYHSETGCIIPREDRSGTCRAYRCNQWKSDLGLYYKGWFFD